MSVARLIPVSLCVALAACGGGGRHERPRMPAVKVPPKAVATASAVRIPGGAGHLAAMARAAGMTVRAKPGGRVVAHLRSTTAWGSPTVVWAAARRGRWLGVVTPSLPNNTLGWIDVRHDRPRMWRSRLTLSADLSARTLELRRGAKVLRRIPVAIGGPSTPTPVGRFTVTDKLIPDRSVAYYGCCLLALSGHQPKLRPGWAGGDRIAIHGGAANQFGGSSAGCLRADGKDLRVLMKAVPLGTPVVIRN
jgi:hypothetical protein